MPRISTHLVRLFSLLLLAAICSTSSADDWQVLFDGSSLDAWEGYKSEKVPDGWVIEGNTLFRKDGGGDIITKKEYADFELTFEWKISDGGNSGVMYRVGKGDGAPYLTGPEYQVLDDTKHADGKNPKTSSASFYAMYAPNDLVLKPVGDWNSSRVKLVRNDVEHWLNGVMVVKCTMWSDDWVNRFKRSKFASWGKFASLSKGHIALQDHGDHVWYRNIKVRSISKDASAKGVASNKAARLFFVTESKGFRHRAVTRKGDQLSVSERVMTELGVRSGLFRANCTQDSAKDFTRERLEETDIVMFYTTNDLPIEKDVLDYFFNDWLKQPGHGFIGTHSAADTFHNYKPYWDMIGGTFNGHPWGSGDTVTIAVHDTDHPVSKPWGGREFVIKDEIYRFKNWQPEKVHVLMSLDMAKTNKKAPYHVPVAWVKDYGQGKVMHMSLGHREDVWTNATYQESLLGGIKWILGMDKGDATPNPELSKAEEQKAREAVAGTAAQ